MAKDDKNIVIISTEFTYEMDVSRRRTLPVGWQGPVPADVAGQIKEEGAGEIVGDLTKSKRKPTKKQLAAAKKAEEEAALTGDSNEEANPDLDESDGGSADDSPEGASTNENTPAN